MVSGRVEARAAAFHSLQRMLPERADCVVLATEIELVADPTPSLYGQATTRKAGQSPDTTHCIPRAEPHDRNAQPSCTCSSLGELKKAAPAIPARQYRAPLGLSALRACRRCATAGDPAATPQPTLIVTRFAHVTPAAAERLVRARRRLHDASIWGCETMSCESAMLSVGKTQFDRG